MAVDETHDWELKFTFHFVARDPNSKIDPCLGLQGGNVQVGGERIGGVQLWWDHYPNYSLKLVVVQNGGGGEDMDESTAYAFINGQTYYCRLYTSGNGVYYAKVATLNYDDLGGTLRWSLDVTSSNQWDGTEFGVLHRVRDYGEQYHADTIVDDICFTC